MKFKVLFCLVMCVFFMLACRQSDEDDSPEIDPAESLYGIWNRLEFGTQGCEDPFDNNTQFGDGSVSFAKGGFYATYTLRNGQDRVNTVRFTVRSDSVHFVNTGTSWKYEVEEDNLDLKTNGPNGCLRYFRFVRSSQAL